MPFRRLVVLSVLLVASAVVGSLVLVGDRSPDGAPDAFVAEHPVAAPEEARTVLVSSAMPMPSAHARRLSAMLEGGAMPPGPVTGEVLSDTQCAPDAEGVSRCRNDVRLADGTTVVLRHPHDMAVVPCLAPGETVRLVPA